MLKGGGKNDRVLCFAFVLFSLVINFMIFKRNKMFSGGKISNRNPLDYVSRAVSLSYREQL